MEDLSHPDVKEALRIFNQIAQSHPQTKWAEMGLNQIAWTYYKGKAYQRSQTEFSNLIINYPDSVQADDWQFMRGKINYDAAKYDIAIKEFQKVIDTYTSKSRTIQRNKVPEAYIMLARCKLKQKRYQESINDFQEFILDFPQDNLVAEALIGTAEANYEQGNSQYKQGIYSKALNYLDKAIKICTDNKSKHILLNEVFPNAYFMKADIYIKQNNKEEAKSILEELIEEFRMSPRSEEASKILEELK